MPPLVRKPKWPQLIEKSPAIAQIQSGSIDSATLAELALASNQLLQSKKRQTRTEKCDILFAKRISSLDDASFVREVGTLACLHLLRNEQARGQIVARLPEAIRNYDASSGLAEPGIESLIPAYLACIIVGRKIRGEEVVSEDEAVAATELLKVVQWRGQDPPPLLWKLLYYASQEHPLYSKDLITDNLVLVVLRRSNLPNIFIDEVEHLLDERKLVDAYKLVWGVQQVYRSDRENRVLRQLFPAYTMWVTWSPDHKRLRQWADGTKDLQQRERLFPLFDLEGPDFTGGQASTLRRSEPRFYACLNPSNPSETLQVVDDILLGCLDKAVTLGHESINLLVQLCLGSRTVDFRRVRMVQEALKFKRDAVSGAFSRYLQAMTSTSHSAPAPMLEVVAEAIAEALPLMTQSELMQQLYGVRYDIQLKGPNTIIRAQKQLWNSLHSQQPSERLAFAVGSLGRSLGFARWLHADWDPNFLAMLSNMPPEVDIKAKMRTIQTGRNEQERQYCIAYLSRYLASIPPQNPAALSFRPSLPVAPPGPPRLPPHPSFQPPAESIWEIPLEFDHRKLRTNLRKINDLPLQLATDCISQSKREDPYFIEELNKRLGSKAGDQTVVSLAELLADRIRPKTIVVDGRRRVASSGFRVHPCWKELLLHIIRRCCDPGLLHRKSNDYLRDSYQGATRWNNWIENLRLVLGDKFLDREDGGGGGDDGLAPPERRSMGLTEGEIRRLSAKFRPDISRNSSTSTSSTGVSGSSIGRAASRATITPLSDLPEDWRPARFEDRPS